MGLAYGSAGYDNQLKVPDAWIYIQVVVLDKADRMFNLDFIKDIRWLFRRMPAADERLNMLFSPPSLTLVIWCTGWRSSQVY